MTLVSAEKIETKVLIHGEDVLMLINRKIISERTGYNLPNITMHEIAGIKVFKIGSLPETGDIREQMYYWSRRWDGWEVEEKDGKRIYTQAPQEIIGVEEEPVPISDIWKITSSYGETRHFNKGEIFPEGEGVRTQDVLLGPQMGLTI